MPPTGGFGGNTGIADAHTHVWKLSMVLAGTAGPALLDSYETERKPQCELIVEQAYARYIKRVDPSLPTTNLAPLLGDVAIELGSVYCSEAILDENERRDDAAPVEDPQNPSGRPGTRMPHITLQLNGASCSTLDLPDNGFALLAGADGLHWVEAAHSLAAAELPLTVHGIAPAGALVDADGRLEEKVGIGVRGALLLRPDGVIAWRTARAHPDPLVRLRDVMTPLTFGR